MPTNCDISRVPHGQRRRVRGQMPGPMGEVRTLKVSTSPTQSDKFIPTLRKVFPLMNGERIAAITTDSPSTVPDAQGGLASKRTQESIFQGSVWGCWKRKQGEVAVGDISRLGLD